MSATSKGRAIVLSPAQPGGLGDQAMLDVAVTELSARGFDVTVLPNPTPVRGQARQIDGGGAMGKARLILELLRARQVVVIGADILDGGYHPGPILRRLKLAQLAHRMGARVRIVGSSFSKSPNPEVARWLKQADWLDILARDPISQARMTEAFGRKVPLVADTAFLLEPQAQSPAAVEAIDWAVAQKAAGKRVLALNVSGLVFSKYAKGALQDYATTLADWLGAHPDIAVMVLAHDQRRGTIGDVMACDTLWKTVEPVAPGRSFYLREGIQAWDVKAVAGQFDMALLCRMHFAIACLGRGVPPLSLVSMGKFEGLMEHFGLEGLTLDPSVARNAVEVGAALDRLARDAARHRTRIEAALPNVKALSAQNYDL